MVPKRKTVHTNDKTMSSTPDSSKRTKSNNGNETEEHEELMCSVCSELFVKAITLNCSHTFCNYCVTKWRDTNDSCPVCREPITSANATLVIDNIVQGMVEKFSAFQQGERERLCQQREQLCKELNGVNQQHNNHGDTVEISDSSSDDSWNTDSSIWNIDSFSIIDSNLSDADVQSNSAKTTSEDDDDDEEEDEEAEEENEEEDQEVVESRNSGSEEEDDDDSSESRSNSDISNITTDSSTEYYSFSMSF